MRKLYINYFQKLLKIGTQEIYLKLMGKIRNKYLVTNKNP